jgi:hypothetical protein
MKANHAIILRIPAFLLLLHLVAYGPLIPWLGFYWDDWPSIWFLHFLGPQGYGRVFAEDRPLLGLLFQLTTPLLGESTIAWQIFGFLARWVASLAFWGMLREAFPQRPRIADWAAILFAVYPGFMQQYIAVTYSHIFLIQTIFFLSITWMLRAVRAPASSPVHTRWLEYLLSVLSSAFTMFTVEYFFGLELLRPVLLWYGQNGASPRKRLARTLLAWLPFVVLMATFLLWRVVLSDTPRGDITLFEPLRQSPVLTLIKLMRSDVLPDMFESSVLAWAQTVDFLRFENFGRLPTLGFILVAAAAGVSSALWLSSYLLKVGSTQSHRQSFGLMLIGLFALFIGGWPFWATNLPIELRFPWDRFTLAMMPGASFLFAGLILLIRQTRWQWIVLSVMIGLAVGAHFETANIYRRDWNQQTAFFWQLAWRAPGIQPGTALITSELPFTYFSDNSLTAPLNWLYAPEKLAQPMPYLLSALESRLGVRIEVLEPGLPIYQPYRAAAFRGTTSQVILLQYSPPGCLKLLDPAKDARLPQKPKYLSDAMKLSQLDFVIPQPELAAQPPLSIFGQPPKADWCYYFEKAELAAQQSLWEQIIPLSQQAFGLNTRLYEVNAPELLPYIEAHAQTGDWERAVELSIQAHTLTGRMDRILCTTWERILTQTPQSASRQQAEDKLAEFLNCE